MRAFSFFHISFISDHGTFHFWTYSDDVATLFPSSSLSHSLSHLSLFLQLTHSYAHSYLLSLFLFSPFHLCAMAQEYSLLLSLPPPPLSDTHTYTTDHTHTRAVLKANTHMHTPHISSLSLFLSLPSISVCLAFSS